MRLRFTPRATRQLESVLGHLASRSPRGAASVARRVSEVSRLLTDHPFSGRLTARQSVRRIILVPYPYAVDYRVDVDEVVVLGIRHTSRRPIS